MYDGVRTLGAILAARADEEPEREVVAFEDGAITFGAWDEQASRIANALAELGLGKGDKAAIQLPNCPEFLAAWFGMARAGVVEVPLNVGLRGDLLAYTLNQAECRVLVISAEWRPRTRPDPRSPSSRTTSR
jgi:crotonobetaine/carnitine-CoA ligase